MDQFYLHLLHVLSPHHPCQTIGSTHPSTWYLNKLHSPTVHFHYHSQVTTHNARFNISVYKYIFPNDENLEMMSSVLINLHCNDSFTRYGYALTWHINIKNIINKSLVISLIFIWLMFLTEQICKLQVASWSCNMDTNVTIS